MASRREQKERLRQEREAREAAAQSQQRRRQLIGYGVGGAVVLVVVIVAAVLLAGGGGGGGGGEASADVLPDGGSYPEPREDVALPAAAKAAGCELKSYKAKSREHVASLDAKIKYASKPPTSGDHYQEPADEGAYEDPPETIELVHTMEHGRIIIWFERDLPADQRAALKAYYDDDTYQMVLVPDTTGMPYEVAATAWNRDPRPNGTGRLLGCPQYNDDIFTAIETFKDQNRGIGPEPVP